MFLAPRIFWRWAPKILDRHYKIRPSADHHAKFCADRLTHLEDLTLKGKNICSKISLLRKLSLLGGLINE